MKGRLKRKRKDQQQEDNRQRTLLSFFASTSPPRGKKNDAPTCDWSKEETTAHYAGDGDGKGDGGVSAINESNGPATNGIDMEVTSSTHHLKRPKHARSPPGDGANAADVDAAHGYASTETATRTLRDIGDDGFEVSGMGRGDEHDAPLPAFTSRPSRVGRHGLRTRDSLRAIHNSSSASIRSTNTGLASTHTALSLQSRRSYTSPNGRRPLLLPGDTILASSTPLPTRTCAWRQEEMVLEVMENVLVSPVGEIDEFGVLAEPQHNAEAQNRLSMLSDEQRAALQVALDGISFFFTGSAGTGKSFLLKEMIYQLRNKHRDGIFVTASTGVAACNIGGITLHGFAGVGLAKGPAESLAAQIMKTKWTSQRWRSAKVLVVDEVSMLEPEFFDKMEKVARIVRDSNLPFGGIQVILCGDFLQLPPVIKGGDTKFCFEADCWNTVIKKTIVLKQVFRQADSDFVKILNQIRVGKLSGEAREMLERCLLLNDSVKADDGKEKIVPTRLYSHRKDVDAENIRFLKEIDAESHMFYAEDEGTNPYLKQLQQNCPAPFELELKVGAQVILLKNLDFESELVNGARGIVVEFRKPDRSEREKERDKAFAKQDYPDVLFSNGERRIITPENFTVEVGGSVKALRKQVPLGLAWALSIHKSQGMTINKLEIHLGHVFEYGQAYVALSRATSLEGLKLVSFNPSGIKAHPRVLKYYAELLGESLAAFELPQSTTKCISIASSSSSALPLNVGTSPYFASPLPASSPAFFRLSKRDQSPQLPAPAPATQNSHGQASALVTADDLFFWQHFVANEFDFDGNDATIVPPTAETPLLEDAPPPSTAGSTSTPSSSQTPEPKLDCAKGSEEASPGSIETRPQAEETVYAEETKDQLSSSAGSEEAHAATITCRPTVLSRGGVLSARDLLRRLVADSTEHGARPGDLS